MYNVHGSVVKYAVQQESSSVLSSSKQYLACQHLRLCASQCRHASARTGQRSAAAPLEIFYIYLQLAVHVYSTPKVSGTKRARKCKDLPQIGAYSARCLPSRHSVHGRLNERMHGCFLLNRARHHRTACTVKCLHVVSKNTVAGSCCFGTRMFSFLR